MADLRSNFIGIKSPNPFWLASAPPTDKEYNVVRAFKAGWGGVVWKTLGDPVTNVTSRFWSNDYGNTLVPYDTASYNAHATIRNDNLKAWYRENVTKPIAGEDAAATAQRARSAERRDMWTRAAAGR